jgi:alpha-1,2-mannosyltransferase
MATVTLYPPFIEVLEWGQLAPMLLALLVLDELVLRGGWRGVGVGVASAIKLYPLVFVVAWMFRREWRSVATALLTFAATTTLASVLWPQSAWSFFVDLMWNGRDVSHLATNHATVVSSQSIASMLNRPPLALDASYQWVGLLVAAVVACAGLFGAHRLWLRRQHVGACVVLIALASLSSPVAWDHYFCFAPLLWWVASEATPHSRLRRSSVTAAIVLLVPWNFWRREKVTDLWISVYEFVTRNAIGFAALSVVLAAVLDAWKPQRNVVTTHPPSSSERVRPLL